MDIKQSPAGQIIKSPKGYDAFVPYNLPPKLVWNTAMVNSLSRADFLLGQLAREGSKLPNPHLLIRPFITREMENSSSKWRFASACRNGRTVCCESLFYDQ